MSNNTMSKFDMNKLDDYEAMKMCFKGKDIRQWIMDNLNSEDLDNRYFAKSIYDMYYKNGGPCTLADSQYYYIYNHAGKMRYMIKRDKVVSPETKKYPIKVVRFKHLQKVLDDIDCLEYEIKFNPKLNNYDRNELRRIHKLLNYRIKLVLQGRKLDISRFFKYSDYTRMQIHSIYSDMLLDLAMLKVNIF